MTGRTTRGRTLAALLATGLATGALGTGAGPAAADPAAPAALPANGPATGTAPAKGGPATDPLGAHDRDLLAEALEAGEDSVTVLLATRPGAAPGVDAAVERLGGTVGARNDEVGYVRATVPTGAVDKAAALRDVLAVDLNEDLALPEPDLSQPTAEDANRPSPTAPGPGTPDANPFMPTRETGAAQAKAAFPQYDGRGVTIGVLDSGVALDHPALQETTTGERKIVDWVTATDPLLEGDASWRAMLTAVSGPTFSYAEQTWTAPEGDFFINRFAESATAGGELDGDVNRDGDTTDRWGVLYRPSDHAIWVDVDQDLDFTDEMLMRPYREDYQVGEFGTDDPDTAVREVVPFVVEYREDVDLSPAGLTGRTADFVNIGIVAGAHGTHVAGITAANGLFGGEMDGAAPGATVVSSRACTFAGGCTAVALTEGMLDLAAERGADVINMSIGGLPALNDGQNARAYLYNRIIDVYGVQLFISAGNSGPGVNTVGDPSVASDVVSVGASISKETWLANYGSVVSAPLQMFNFSSRGPREDGGFKPNIAAPGSAVSTTPLWQPGAAVADTGYTLPPGYGMFNGTSMAAPQATGAAALVLSAADQLGERLAPAQLRQAMYSTARQIPGVKAHEQGTGQLDVLAAARMLVSRVETQDYTVSAPVCTTISQFLVTPDRGTGIYNRCAADAGGHAPGQRKAYDVTVTRTSGAAGAVRHSLSWAGNDGTFRSAGSVVLPLDTPVTVRVTATPSAGVHSAILRIDDPATTGVDHFVMNAVVASTDAPVPAYAGSVRGSVERNRSVSYFVTVPEGANALQVNLDDVTEGSQTRFIAFNPYGVPVESTSSLVCYTTFSDVRACNPTSRAYPDPLPGVWEIQVESRRTSPVLRNPYRLTAAVQGVTVDPAQVELDTVPAGEPTAVSWEVANEFGPVTVTGTGGPLGSSASARPSIATGGTDTSTVEVPAGATRLDVSIGNTSDLSADLDLYVYRDGTLVGYEADGDSEESVSLTDPQPGTYTVEVEGYAVPGGTTDYDYADVFFSPGLGQLAVDDSPQRLAFGGTATVAGTVTALAAPAEGRRLFGEMTVRSSQGAVLGRGTVVIGAVTG